MKADRQQGRTGKFRKRKGTVTGRSGHSLAPNVIQRRRSPVAHHAGINKASTHPDQSKTLPRFKKHKLYEAMFDE